MSMIVQIPMCNITSLRASKDGNDSYVNLASQNEDGSISNFSLTFKGTPISAFSQYVLKPVSFKGQITGIIWDNAQRLQAVGQFGAPIEKSPKQGA